METILIITAWLVCGSLVAAYLRSARENKKMSVFEFIFISSIMWVFVVPWFLLQAAGKLLGDM